MLIYKKTGIKFHKNFSGLSRYLTVSRYYGFTYSFDTVMTHGPPASAVVGEDDADSPVERLVHALVAGRVVPACIGEESHGVPRPVGCLGVGKLYLVPGDVHRFDIIGELPAVGDSLVDGEPRSLGGGGYGETGVIDVGR